MAQQREHRGTGGGLAGGGPSIVGVSGAMRARDVSRIRPEDEEKAARKPIRRNPRPATGEDQPRTS